MRLIDANELNFVCSYNGMCMAINEKCKKCEYYVCSFEDVQNQPTAYDPEKVVEQLEEELKSTEYTTICEPKMRRGYDLGIKKALEIVKSGGAV